ncbi:Fis family transcriptional regulator [Pseudomaricurvus sp.]|uniref:Fis family transcriptional regulator n=1 Tax=Pseudomaricurvus sp. TaxID=2004510 RepID=UPI003F6D0933
MAKPQSKTEKKIDNNIRLALTDVCEQVLGRLQGFEWLTHQANYTNFPASLLVTCVFDTEENLQAAITTGEAEQLKKQIQMKLLKIGVKFKALNQQVVFDSEEACELHSEGSWARRLEARKGRSVLKNRPS